jgi:uracil-DNA glycosylase
VREVVIEPHFESWRSAARMLIAEGAEPEKIVWREAPSLEAPGLFEERLPYGAPQGGGKAELRVPKAFVDLARSVSAHRDPERWRLLYSVLWRLAAGDRNLLLRRDDPDLQRLRSLDAELQQGLVPPPAGGAASFVPRTEDLRELERAAVSCRGCDLYRNATQTVFGKGPSSARAVLVGEAPGDQEDLQGAPFVGPAGDVLDRALSEASIPRSDVYVTNAVKHFKFVERGKRRIHQTPGSTEIGACRPWLEAELAVIRPRVLVCLGATASKALLGPDFRLMKERGRFLHQTRWAPKLLATLHPSAVLRAEDQAGQDRLYGLLLTDLRLVAGELGG